MNIFEILYLSFAAIFAVQVIFAIFAIIKKTDKLTDLSYGLTFIINSWLIYATVSQRNLLHLLISILVTLWGLRLAIYLFIRILKTGKDDRFDNIRIKPIKFIGFWLLQAISVFLISLPVTLFLSYPFTPSPEIVFSIGLFIWIIGFLIEMIADAQKFKFKSNPLNKGKFIQSGLWKYSRHPNYFGEIIQWWAIFIMGVQFISGVWMISIIGPIFITILILFVSGIPTLEKRYNEIYKNDKDYQDYVKKTFKLIPFFTKKV